MSFAFSLSCVYVVSTVTLNDFDVTDALIINAESVRTRGWRSRGRVFVAGNVLFLARASMLTYIASLIVSQSNDQLALCQISKQ